MNGLRVVFRRMNLRHLGRHRLRTLLTTVGIAAGVALVFSIAVINATLLSSFRSSIQDLAGAAEIEVASADQTGIPESSVKEIEALDGVERAVPVVRTTSTIRAGGGQKRVLVLGITPEFGTLFPEGLGELARLRISGGFGGERDVLLARPLADEIGAARDQTVEVETPLGQEELNVSGFVSGGAISALNGGNVAIMLLPSAQEVLDRVGLVDSVYVVVERTVSVGDMERDIDAVLGGGALVGPPGERGEGLERVFSGLGSLLSLAGTVSLFVALFVVFNTMSMALAERRREISMSMALGAERKHVFGAFMLEAGSLGIVASALGIAGGALLARVLVDRAVEAYQLFPVQTEGPMVMRPSHAVLAAVCGLGVSLLGAYIPARRVLSVAPIEALRPEASYEWSQRPVLGGHRVRLPAGMAGLAVATIAFIATGSKPDSEWIVQVGLVAGLAGITFLLPYIVPFAVTILRPVFTRLFGTVGRLATDALSKNPGRTTFTVAALVLTLGLVIGVGSALGSYQRQIRLQAEALIGAPIYVSARSFTGVTSDQPLSGSLEQELEAVEGVAYVYPLRFLFLDVEGSQGLLFAIGVEDAISHGATSVLSSITDDPETYLRTLREGGLAVSVGTAERHELEPGDTLALRTPGGLREFVVGSTYSDLVSFDSLYIDHETYQEHWDDRNVDQFGVLPEPGVDVEVLKERLIEVVDRNDAPALVLGKEQVIGRLLETIEGTFALGQGIQLAALVVAAITIANTLFTAVLERRWEMGLQRAIGMGGRQLSSSVLLEAAGIGLIGGLGGALLGTASGMLMLESMEAQFGWEVPFQLPFAMGLMAVVGGILLAGVVGLFPSRLAVRASIIGSLRYE